MFKHGANLSHAEIKARLHGVSRERPAEHEAGAKQSGFDPDNPSILPAPRSGPAWRSGLRAWNGVTHHPGKMDTPDIGRGKVITY